MTLTLELPPWAKHESSLIQVLVEKKNRTGEATELGRGFSARYLVPYMAQHNHRPTFILPFLLCSQAFTPAHTSAGPAPSLVVCGLFSNWAVSGQMAGGQRLAGTQ